MKLHPLNEAARVLFPETGHPLAWEAPQRLWYLATPYSHEQASVREARFRAAARIAGLLMVEYKIPTFSPITHSHPISDALAKFPGSPGPCDYVFWVGWDEHIRSGCDGLIVVQLPGWEQSRGMALETQRFLAEAKPVLWIEPMVWFSLEEWRTLQEGETG